jgi:hypothetical protein
MAKESLVGWFDPDGSPVVSRHALPAYVLYANGDWQVSASKGPDMDACQIVRIRRPHLPALDMQHAVCSSRCWAHDKAKAVSSLIAKRVI